MVSERGSWQLTAPGGALGAERASRSAEPNPCSRSTATAPRCLHGGSAPQAQCWPWGHPASGVGYGHRKSFVQGACCQAEPLHVQHACIHAHIARTHMHTRVHMHICTHACIPMLTDIFSSLEQCELQGTQQQAIKGIIRARRKLFS